MNIQNTGSLSFKGMAVVPNKISFQHKILTTFWKVSPQSSQSNATILLNPNDDYKLLIWGNDADTYLDYCRNKQYSIPVNGIQPSLNKLTSDDIQVQHKCVACEIRKYIKVPIIKDEKNLNIFLKKEHLLTRMFLSTNFLEKILSKMVKKTHS